MLFAKPSEPDVETSAPAIATPTIARERADLFALPPVEEPATSYFERTATYNKRHLAAVGAAAVVVAVLAGVVVRGVMKPTPKPTLAAMTMTTRTGGPRPPRRRRLHPWPLRPRRSLLRPRIRSPTSR